MDTVPLSHRAHPPDDPGPGPAPAPDTSARAEAPHKQKAFRDRIRRLLVEYAENRQIEVRDELVKLHLNLVNYAVARFASRGEPREDLYQVGCIGLLKAIDRYDAGHGAEFTTFAIPTIVGEIRRYFRDLGWAMKVSRGLQELNVSIHKAVDQMSTERGRPPTVAELAAHLHVTTEQIMEAQEIGQVHSLLSIDAGTSNPDSMSLSECLGKNDIEIERVEDTIAATHLFKCLSPREQIVIYMAFYKNASQSKIAEVLQTSQMGVSRLQARALGKMRASVEEKDKAPT